MGPEKGEFYYLYILKYINIEKIYHQKYIYFLFHANRFVLQNRSLKFNSRPNRLPMKSSGFLDRDTQSSHEVHRNTLKDRSSDQTVFQYFLSKLG